MLASLVMVDAVVIFDEDTPLELIERSPGYACKGRNYTLEQIVGVK
jgi:D-beta-D-heptose 7-phosphate kinase/D-beta-D-heptose 1-phosphate adenosyltransferase